MKTIDPILAHHVQVLKLVRQSIYPDGLSDCCRSAIVEVNDFDVCTCCLQHCTPTPA